jgi:hypothetical protein
LLLPNTNDLKELYRIVYSKRRGKIRPRFSLEHIIPRSQGATTSLDNIALAYQGCNNHKYNKVNAVDTVTNQLVALFHRRTQRWQDHFTWDERFELIIGLTATGRATVEALQLNRPELINLRKLLYAAGKHPLPATEDTLA